MEESDRGYGASTWGSLAEQWDDGGDVDIEDLTGLDEHCRVFCGSLVLLAKGGTGGPDAQLPFVVAGDR